MAYFRNGALVERFTLITASGGTTALLATSTTYQIVTGTNTHTLTLPDATTCDGGANGTGGHKFIVYNRSTGSLTVKDYTGNTIVTLAPSVDAAFVSTSSSTAAGNWVVSKTSASGPVSGDYVSKSGDTMTGALTLSGAPTATLHAATKGYVDSVYTQTIIDNETLESDLTTAIATSAATKVSKSGDTMTGALTLSGAPTANLHAATKAYVDSIYQQTVTNDESLESELSLTIVSQVATRVAKSGDTMTGALTLSGDPTATFHAATKNYVDASTNSAVDAAVALAIALG